MANTKNSQDKQERGALAVLMLGSSQPGMPHNLAEWAGARIQGAGRQAGQDRLGRAQQIKGDAQMFSNKRMVVMVIGVALFALFILSGCAPGAAGASETSVDRDAVEVAAIEGLAEIGWDTNGFAAELAQIAGEYAQVRISSNQGGFTVYLKQADGQWQVVLHGSAFSPMDLDAAGIPAALRPPGM